MRNYKIKSCLDCGIDILATPSAKRCRDCNHKKRNTESLSRAKRLHDSGVCYCGRPLAKGYTRCEACHDSATRTRNKHRDKKNAQTREYLRGLRTKALEAYGNKCACCGESHQEFLAIDHIGGWGKNHRNEKGVRILGTALYLELKRKQYPEGFRVLCHCCNGSLGYYGYCPHEREREEASKISS